MSAGQRRATTMTRQILHVLAPSDEQPNNHSIQGNERPAVLISHQCGVAREGFFELGQSRIRLPFGGIASSETDEVREPRIPTFALLAAIGVMAIGLLTLARFLWLQ